MAFSLRPRQLTRTLIHALGCALLTVSAGVVKGYAQCPTIDNIGWPHGATVRYVLDANLSAEQQRQIRIAVAEWNRANSLNNSGVRFEEVAPGQSFQLRFLNGTLSAGTPAFVNKNYDGNRRVTSATLTFDPNATFPGTSSLIINPAQPGYDTIFIKLTLHEMGHSMGLDHPPVPAEGVCAQPDGATVMNYVCNANDRGNNLPTTVTACDQNAINSQPIYTPVPVPPPVTVQFSGSVFSASEGAGSVLVTVTRSNTAGASTVDYSTPHDAGLTACGVSNGLASERCDFTTTAGTLRFAPGVGALSIRIPITDDSYAEGSETFTLTLFNPVNATLGGPSSAVVTIADNDAAPSRSRVYEAEFFARQQYRDFLGRDPDPTGLQNWVATLQACPGSGFAVDVPACDRVRVSAGFFQSDEFQARGYFAYRFYAAGLGRRPAFREFVSDMLRVGGAQSPEDELRSKDEFSDEFVLRAEFRQRYDHLTNPADYVTALERTAGVALDPALKTQLISRLQSDPTMTRAQALRAVVESREVEARFYNEAFVAMQYFGYLRRDPDQTGFANWVQTLNQTGNFRHMIFGFIYSDEYIERFGPK